MINIKELSNGIRVVFEPMDYLKSVSFGVWIRVGSANEDSSNNGISHMIEHMLFKGTKNRTAKMLADEMARMGGNMNAYTSKECTSFYVTTLDYYLPMAIDILSDMLCHSNLEEADIEKEKEVVLEEIDMYNDSPEDLVHEMLQKSIWKDHPLGYIISGDKETVSSFTRQQIIQYMEQYYTADNIVLSLAGHFNEKEVMDQLEQCFGKIKSSNSILEVSKPVYHKCFYRKEKDIEQVYMNIAFDCVDYNSKEKYAMAIINAILGGSENSRLFQVIREELGLVYSICSYESSYQKAGLFHLDVVLNPSKLIVVYETIFKILDQLKCSGITEEELMRTKEQMKTELIIGSESTRNRMSSNGKWLLARGFINSLEDTIQYINDVSLKEVNEFMDRYLTADSSSLSLVGNLSELNKFKKHFQFD
jgi:Predicted Zn-dependent peptidases